MTKTHGHSPKTGVSRTYRTWWAMQARCKYPNHPAYKDYGARGIKVCARWSKFSNFLVDMGEAPQGLSLDRVDNDKGYIPKNCRWASRLTQGRNKRNNRKIKYKSEENTLSEWCEKLNVAKNRVQYRLRKGWDIDKVFSSDRFKAIPKKVQVKYKGKMIDLWHLCAKYKLKFKTVYARIFVYKWTIEDALNKPLNTRKSRKLVKTK